MQINTSNPVSSQVQGVEATPKASEVKREDDKAAGRQSGQAAEAENPDYRINLSAESKQAIAELRKAQPASQNPLNIDLDEDEAARISQQASGQLAQTNVAIANQAMAKAVDLFT
ncbi:MAG: hypothetical protein CSA23_07640 [Deltaproteobacteria bacterium]|nr:MAG: hypothetical protein CSA23_07640 [Deltaproteobacteria bacterium]